MRLLRKSGGIPTLADLGLGYRAEALRRRDRPSARNYSGHRSDRQR